MAFSTSIPILLLTKLLLISLFTQTIVEGNSNTVSIKNASNFLQFYIQVKRLPPNATTMKVVSNPFNSSLRFGSIYVMDDIITTGPNPNSTEVGRIQGILVVVSPTVFDRHLSASLVFSNTGETNVSTLSLLGAISGLKRFSEIPVVGGTGEYQNAQGQVLLGVQSVNNITGIVTQNLKVFLDK